MNKFDTFFFKKYTPEWHDIIDVIHTHPIIILKSIFFKMLLLVWLPVFIFYNSILIQTVTPFIFFEIYLFIIYINIIYDIFDWYNDVWIVTNHWVVWLEWSLFKSNSDTLSFDNIEWIWVEQDWVIDKTLWKWDLVIHKIWDDSFVLKDAIKPYKALDLIEATSEMQDDLDNMESDKFDMIMDALGWVVWNYLEKSKSENSREQIIHERIRKIENKENTIDLR